ncbi:cysteine peptidase family C39 domain-containing protein [Fulvivirgaceae bacterium BMA12]|uniref:Cysteine peptidase family C39 domain-containing protein n=1 Tax=Agaribacillus aureus TaxID=3051825 RepID=A0ABT8LFR6_9BACT|nr:cysteine peptidase family C39 domain-containing protein [Fulvivirgaceae bacterium BMA12]
MKWIPQVDGDDNAIAATKNLMSLRKLKVNQSTITKTLRGHNEYPNLLSITDAMQTWKIRNMAVQLSIGDLSEIDYPVISHLNRNQGEYIVLLGVNDDQVSYLDMQSGKVTAPKKTFEKEWSGATLLVDPDENSGEKDYHQVRKKEFLSRYRLPVAFLAPIALVGLALFFVGIPGDQWINGWSLLLVAKIAGSALSASLLSIQWDKSSNLINRLCRISSTAGCQSVLASPAAKLLGSISMAEIGALYFIGGFLGLALSLTANTASEVFYILGMLNILALPYIVFSLYYQARVIRQWCPLCLAVQGVLGLEFLIFLSFSEVTLMPVSAAALFTTFWGFLLPAMAIFLLGFLPEKLARLEKTEDQAKKLKDNPMVYSVLLRQKEPIDPVNLPLGFEYGSSEAPNTITLVINPFCTPCLIAYQQMTDYLLTFPGCFKLKIILTAGGNTSGDSNLLLRHLLTIRKHRGMEAARQAMDNWYAMKHKSYKKWAVSFPEDLSDNEGLVRETLNRQSEWLANSDIIATPTIVINNLVLPDIWNVKDLYPHLKLLYTHMLAKADEKRQQNAVHE